ncbi:MAG: metal-dependent transcriptional regulator [Actinomycetota bacterium]|nr:MAG: DtxR family transcriptional regulator Mn-dependent transcriptional [Actinomycetota bacterium]MDO8949735.1 metal-dependent transcriptional regulator [Actinomycetota bacterium]MDP3629832.1 metal-dependent transcriptional regulator [Actinomycetota bacterium]
MPSQTLEEYLEAIYKLAEHGEARPSRLAEAMGVAAPTVTSTLKRLKTRGLITRPGGAIALTPTGRSEALNIIRRHRLAERFLVDVLGMAWEDVHEEACRLEHALSPKVQAALETYLENPDVCPHGHPIPSAEGAVAEVTGDPLCGFDTGADVQIIRIEEEDERLLSYLASLGMYPGTRVKVCDVAPFHGPLMVEIGGSRYALGRDVAAKIVVGASTARAVAKKSARR